MKKSVKKIRIHTTLRSSMFWSGFYKALSSGGGTNDQGYIGIFTREAHLVPAEYQFGDKRVIL